MVAILNLNRALIIGTLLLSTLVFFISSAGFSQESKHPLGWSAQPNILHSQEEGGKGVNKSSTFTSPTTRTIEPFQKIKKGMSADELFRLCGKPDGDIGSGNFVYVYHLADESDILVSLSDRVLQVTHRQKDGSKHFLLNNK